MSSFQRIVLLLFANGTLACSGENDSKAETSPAANDTSLSFFITSSGTGELGGNLGGIDGADARCEQLALAVGASAKVWRAYLSTTTVSARDRIGKGPWYNANGDMIAANVDSLHSDGVKNGDPQHMMDEYGSPVPVTEHDILTGSDSQGRLFMARDRAANCDDWTLSVSSVGPRVGHSDIPPPQFSPSWNDAHTAPGCDRRSLERVGGSGRSYCFAE